MKYPAISTSMHSVVIEIIIDAEIESISMGEGDCYNIIVK